MSSLNFSSTHLPFLYRCLQLARLGGTAVVPNPQVGAVIVRNGQIIGEGFHPYSGGPHAEVVAIQSVQDEALLKDARIYVSLEPCSHYGKTPPCADLIVEKGIPHVVVGCLDPNPKVAGRGVARLRKAGVKVEVARDQKPFQHFLRHFIINQQQKRPYITLKWAESKDGYIAKLKDGKASPVAITQKQSNSFTHKLRSQHQSILVGSQTALIDNPQLTNRHFYGSSPLRIVFDSQLRLPTSLKLFNDQHPTLILNSLQSTQEAAVQYHATQATELPELMQELYAELGICSILVEGGAETLRRFMEANMWDEIYVMRSARVVIGEGVKAPVRPQNMQLEALWGADEVWHLYNSGTTRSYFATVFDSE